MPKLSHPCDANTIYSRSSELGYEKHDTTVSRPANWITGMTWQYHILDAELGSP